MISNEINLTSFEHTLNHFSGKALIERQENRFILDFCFNGRIDQVFIPESIGTSYSRGDQLWEDTCLEFFIKDNSTGHYIEFNFSPSGNWNSYFFEDYRKGMSKYYETSLLDLSSHTTNDTFSTKIHFQLEKSDLFNISTIHLYNISAILKLKNGDLSHWAHRHPKSDEPDFHHPFSFSKIL